MEVVEGDLLCTESDAIVNPWNRNTIPWWLLLPQGVSGAIKRRAGTSVFQELRRFGRLSLGQAVATSAGSLPYRGIIHVAGINDVWRASESSIRLSIRSAVRLAESKGWMTLAAPLIGAGSGGFDPAEAERILLSELESIDSELVVKLVRFKRS